LHLLLMASDNCLNLLPLAMSLTVPVPPRQAYAVAVEPLAVIPGLKLLDGIGQRITVRWFALRAIASRPMSQTLNLFL